MRLNEVKTGESCRVTAVGGEGALRQHLLDMGVIPSAELTVVKLAPMGDPMEIRIHGYELTLRLADAAEIEVEKINITQKAPEAPDFLRKKEHPGLGEGGRFHKKGSREALPDGTLLTFALIGNQNSGKTTLFNQLTGSRQHVGNFPGVTVDRKDGQILGHANTLVTDLPGIYSMSPYTGEELVSRDFVLKEKPKAIINIVDATTIERNLYLTMQLLEMDVPVVVALNMMDEMKESGAVVDINGLEEALGTPVVPISAAKDQGITELVEHAVHIATYQEKPSRQDYCDPEEKGAVHRCIHAVMHLIEDHAARARLPLRFAAGKVVEGDGRIIAELGLDENEQSAIKSLTAQMEKESGLDKNAAMADMRYSFIMKTCGRCVYRPEGSRKSERSQKADRILTGRYTAVPLFFLIMGLVFYLTFNLVGPFLQGIFEQGIEAMTGVFDRALSSAGVSPVIHGLLIDGICGGVGSVVSFLPIIVTMFFFLSMLEDSGYMARVAFVMDKLLRHLGLSGRSIVPLLIGFGCTVPAVMASRTLPSERDRKMTILLTPFMSCTAKLPIYAFFVNAFFPRHGALVMVALYIGGIMAGILVALYYKKTLFKGEAVPFIMELPNYRMPRPRNVLMLLWEKAKDFLWRAFSVILIATVVVWILQSFDFRFNLVVESKDSMLASAAGVLAPLLKPVGLGDWRIVTSLICGFLAKESVVSTLGVLFAGQGGVGAALSTASAAALLVFSLLYTPCVAAIASVRRELGFKWACYVVIWQCLLAWIGAFLAYTICSGLGV